MDIGLRIAIAGLLLLKLINFIHAKWTERFIKKTIKEEWAKKEKKYEKDKERHHPDGTMDAVYIIGVDDIGKG